MVLPLVNMPGYVSATCQLINSRKVCNISKLPTSYLRKNQETEKRTRATWSHTSYRDLSGSVRIGYAEGAQRAAIGPKPMIP